MTFSKKPNLFIVGEPKSGTTALHFLLGQHRDIYMSKEKEPAYFAKDFIQESDEFHKRRLFFHYRNEDEYLSLFRRQNETIQGESSTDYLFSKVAAQEIYEFNPEAKIVIMLRNPIDFLYSLHSEYIQMQVEDVNDFRSALALEAVRKAGKHIPKTVMFPSQLYYLDRANYIVHIDRFFKCFRRDQIKIAFFEEFVQDNSKLSNEVVRFLGLSEFAPKIKIVNPNYRVRSKFAWSFFHQPALKKTARAMMPLSIYNRFKQFLKGMFLETAERAPLSREFREELKVEFRRQVIDLGEVVEKDLATFWGFN